MMTAASANAPGSTSAGPSRRVVVAMSGGVDSSVAALLLQQQGYDPIGVTMKLYDIADDPATLPPAYRGCCTLDDVEDARAVCRILGIPHYTLSVQRQFRRFVIDYFRREYETGRTPHPCIACNDKIKFTFLAQRARTMQAAFVATGHYARIVPANADDDVAANAVVAGIAAAAESPADANAAARARRYTAAGAHCPTGGDVADIAAAGANRLADAAAADIAAAGANCPAGAAAARRYTLRRGLDAAKDQSYVLFGMRQEQLAATLMPVGHYPKDEIRRLAAAAGFPNAHKPDSQDICFIPDGDYREFLRRSAADRPGDIVDDHGNILGQHEGIQYFTIGQRRGLGLPGGGAPRFVIRLEPDTRRVVVGSETDLYTDTLCAAPVSWIAGSPPPPDTPVTVKIRYKFSEAPATLTPFTGADPAAAGTGADPPGADTAGAPAALVRFAEPQRAVTPGQAAVFYQGDTVLGGGPITSPAVAESAVPD